MWLKLTPVCAIICLVVGVAPAMAQAEYQRRTAIEKTCARELERYCPELDKTAQTRNQVICLKPFRLDMTVPCRRAVTAARR